MTCQGEAWLQYGRGPACEALRGTIHILQCMYYWVAAAILDLVSVAQKPDPTVAPPFFSSFRVNIHMEHSFLAVFGSSERKNHGLSG